MKRFATVLMFLTFLAPIETNAGEKSAEKTSGKISGYMFGDYYWIVANHADSLKNQNGFWFRRIYLVYDKGLNDEFSVRFRFEANSPGLVPSLSGKSDRLNPYVKDAYLKWARGRHSILFGLVPVPTWEFAEKVWGYRPVEKTPLDLQKFGAGPRDFGVAFQGALDCDKKLTYSFVIGNGNSIKSETDKDKKFYLSLMAKPATGMTIEAYSDWENRKDDRDVLTVQGIAGYERKDCRVGVQFARQTRQQGTGKADENLGILSVSGSGRLAKKTWGFARFDRMFDPNPPGEGNDYLPLKTDKLSIIIAGIDLKPIPEVDLMPNIEVVTYDKVNDVKPDSDVIPRLTVYYVF